MTIVGAGRAILDATLQDDTSTILILVGSPDSAAGRVHACASGGFPDCGPGIRRDPWRHVFLITDPAVLTAGERAEWFGVTALDAETRAVMADAFVLLDRTTEAVCPGRVSELTISGMPSIVLIRHAFSRCEGAQAGGRHP